MPEPRTKKRRKPAARVWVIVHCEYMSGSKMPRVGEMVFHVASTRAKAEKHMKDCHVDAFSWWKLQRYRLDVDDELTAKTFFYSHTGRPVKKAPQKFAMFHYLRHCRRHGW